MSADCCWQCNSSGSCLTCAAGKRLTEGRCQECSIGTSLRHHLVSLISLVCRVLQPWGQLDSLPAMPQYRLLSGILASGVWMFMWERSQCWTNGTCGECVQGKLLAGTSCVVCPEGVVNPAALLNDGVYRLLQRHHAGWRVCALPAWDLRQHLKRYIVLGLLSWHIRRD